MQSLDIHNGISGYAGCRCCDDCITGQIQNASGGTIVNVRDWHGMPIATEVARQVVNSRTFSPEPIPNGRVRYYKSDIGVFDRLEIWED